MMLSLGRYPFSVNTSSYQQLQRTVAMRWAAVERLGTSPALQALGRAATHITLTGVVYPQKASELSIFSALRTQALTPHWLVDGNGRVWGQWVIQQLQEQHTVFWPNGQPRKITFTVQLMEYANTDHLPDTLTSTASGLISTHNDLPKHQP